jgi:predicted ester cyclase
MLEQNKDLVRRIFEEIWNQGNLAVIDERFASDYLGHSPAEIRGPEGVKKLATAMRGAFTGFRYTTKDQIAEGDRVVTRWTVSGKHEGEFQDLPPSGKQVTMTGIDIVRIANSKIIESWTNKEYRS